MKNQMLMLVSLLVVLGLAASASAIQEWTGAVSSDWSDPANWENSDGPPSSGTTEETYLMPSNYSDPTNNPVVSGDAYGWNTYYGAPGPLTLTIASSGHWMNGSRYRYYGTASLVTDVAGTLTTDYLNMSSAAEVNITGSGLVEIIQGVDSANDGTTTIDSTSAMLQYSGSHESTIIDTFNIVAGSGLSLVVDTTTRSGWTTVYATPEPATVAMLVLGSLALLRKRR